MGMLPMAIDDAVRARMKEIRELAEQRPIPLEVYQALRAGKPIEQGIYDPFTMVVPMGFPMIYTHEVQPPGILRHLSVSIERSILPGRVPHPMAVQMIMEEMGFLELDIVGGKCMWWQEDCGGGQQAINVIEPLDGDWGPFKLNGE